MAVNLAQDSASTWLTAQDAPSLRRVFESITADSCPSSFNFHMHTVCSDGRLQPEQLMEQAIAIGLQGFAITDHHSTQGYRRAQQWLNQWRQSPAVIDHHQSVPQFWTGIEINADLLGDDVHILAYAFDPEHQALLPYMQRETARGELYIAANVINAIHTAGGLAVLAHPARYKRSHHELIPEAASLGIDGVETYYAYNNPSPWQPSPKQTQEVYELGKTYGLLHTCGTDTHGLNLLQRL
jgi:predicted metal-dependent phosphoesterase TrpH